jgi:RimJ/RimL family protein N-acetyltransferase
MQLAYPLESERLVIRPLRPDDLDRHYEIYAKPDVVRYLYEEVLDLEGARQHLSRRCTLDLPHEGEWINLGVEVRGEGVLIGEVGMVPVSNANAHCEIGYVFDSAYSGLGYATEASALMVDMAFSVFAAHRVTGRLDARNGASARVLERLGMRREAHYVENEFVKGEWTDEYVYAVLADEWLTSRGPLTTFVLREQSPARDVN